MAAQTTTGFRVALVSREAQPCYVGGPFAIIDEHGVLRWSSHAANAEQIQDAAILIAA